MPTAGTSFRMRMLSALVTIVLTAAAFSTAGADKSKDICRVFPKGTEIRDPDSCGRYILCNDGVSEYHDCPLNKPLYNKNTNKCEKALVGDAVCGLSCSNKVGKFLPDPKSCSGFYYCQDEENALPGQCPEQTHFNASLQSCIHQHESGCRLNNLDVCSVAKNGVTLKDESNCHKYFECVKGKLVSKTCSNKYYDAAIGACVQKSAVDCPEHPLPKNVCGTAKKPLRNYFAADGATCRGYFYCRDQKNLPDPNPMWGQCGPDTFFSVKKQSCVNPVLVPCKEDRCDGRTVPFVNSGTLGCRNYLRCSNGVTVGRELSCGNNFFDEKSGGCVSNVVKYPACAP